MCTTYVAVHACVHGQHVVFSWICPQGVSLGWKQDCNSVALLLPMKFLHYSIFGENPKSSRNGIPDNGDLHQL